MTDDRGAGGTKKDRVIRDKREKLVMLSEIRRRERFKVEIIVSLCVCDYLNAGFCIIEREVKIYFKQRTVVLCSDAALSARPLSNVILYPPPIFCSPRVETFTKTKIFPISLPPVKKNEQTEICRNNQRR